MGNVSQHSTNLTALGRKGTPRGGGGGGGVLEGTLGPGFFLMSRSNPFPVKLEMASFKLSLGERISTVG